VFNLVKTHTISETVIEGNTVMLYLYGDLHYIRLHLDAVVVQSARPVDNAQIQAGRKEAVRAAATAAAFLSSSSSSLDTHISRLVVVSCSKLALSDSVDCAAN